MLLLPIVGIARDIPEEPGLTYLWRQGDGPIGGGFGISVTLEVIQTERREVMSVNGNLKLTHFATLASINAALMPSSGRWKLILAMPRSTSPGEQCTR